jgi:hypothetical protein
MPQRVRAYVDGFNLYFGMKTRGWKDCYWLDVWALNEALLLPHQELQGVGYFTARISGSGAKRARQRALLAAYEAGRCELHYGEYKTDPKPCPDCKGMVSMPTEKMTDVKIAVELMTDAVRDRFDTALVISGDSDLCPAISRVRELYPRKRVISVFPPDRVSTELKKVASGHLYLGRPKLLQCQMPPTVVCPGGISVQRPPTWA